MVVADALSRSGITRLLDRMERDGLITRTVSTTDRRRFDVSLTPHGRQRFEQAWPAHADGIGRYFVQPLTPCDISDLGQDPGQPDPGQPEPQPARLTPVRTADRPTCGAWPAR